MQLNDENFGKEILNYSGVALIDFFTTWCGPCKMQGSIIDELEKELVGQNVKVGKVDIDESPSVSAKFNVMSVPTLILFKDGKVIETMVGLQSKEALRKKIEDNK